MIKHSTLEEGNLQLKFKEKFEELRGKLALETDLKKIKKENIKLEIDFAKLAE